MTGAAEAPAAPDRPLGTDRGVSVPLAVTDRGVSVPLAVTVP